MPKYNTRAINGDRLKFVGNFMHAERVDSTFSQLQISLVDFSYWEKGFAGAFKNDSAFSRL